MNDWYSGIYKGLIIAGVIAFIIGFFTQGNTSLGAYISGYSVLILGIMMLLTILFYKILNITSDKSVFQIIYSVMTSTGPIILMLGVISFILYLMLTYKEHIISQHVSQGYYSFSNIAIILLLLQLYILYTNIDTDNFEKTGKIPKVTSNIILLLGILAAICGVIIFTILKYFTTDGFSLLSSNLL